MAYATRTDSTTATAERTTNIQRAALVVGLAFLVVGILGFIPGITSNYDDITFASHDSGAELFGIFEVSVLHNIVHLLFGVMGIVASRRIAASRTYLIAGGVIYLALWLYGLVIDRTSDANFVPVNSADNWLHFGLGLGMIILGLALTERRDTVRDTRTEARTR